MGSWNENVGFVRKYVSQQDLYLQLAEEASELSQASSKYVRCLRNKNPTPVEASNAALNVLTELHDVLLVCKVLDLLKQNSDNLDDQERYKLQRWVDRIEKADIPKSRQSECERLLNLVGKVVYGKSDGKAWKVVSIDVENWPYVVSAQPADSEVPVKQLRPEWLSETAVYVSDCQGRKFCKGCFVYDADTLERWKVENVVGTNKVDVSRGGVTRTASSTQFSLTASDSLAHIRNDVSRYMMQPDKYCEKYNVTSSGTEVEDFLVAMMKHVSERKKRVSLSD